MIQRSCLFFLAGVVIPLAAGGQSAPATCPVAPDGVALAMTVIDSTASPMAGVRVDVRHALDSAGVTRPGRSVARAVTDSSGVFCATVPAPGRYVVRRARFRIDRDLHEQELVVDVAPAGATPRVLIYDPYGMTLADQARRRAMLDSLEVQRAQWRERRPETYRLRVELECFCFGALATRPTFVVSGDRVVEILNVAHAIADTAGFLEYSSVHSIEMLFEVAAAQIAGRHRVLTRIEFDPYWGFPRLLSTDGRSGLTDQWSTWRVALFGPVSR